MTRETNNPFDSNAVLVRSSVNGTAAGRVPRGLSNVISQNLQSGMLVHASAFYTGEMQHDGPRQGGGPKLICVYLLECDRHVNLPQLAANIRQFVEEDNMFL